MTIPVFCRLPRKKTCRSDNKSVMTQVRKSRRFPPAKPRWCYKEGLDLTPDPISMGITEMEPQTARTLGDLTAREGPHILL